MCQRVESPDGQARRLGRLLLSGPCLQEGIDLRPAGSIRRHGRDDLIVQLVLSGSLTVHASGAVREVGPGEIVLFDMKRTRHTHARQVLAISFEIGRQCLEAACPGSHLLHGAVLRAPCSALLADTMQSLLRHAPLILAEDAERAVRAFAEMLTISFRAGGLTQNQINPAHDRARLLRARALVERHLASGSLGPGLLAAEMGVSRSRLYDLFKPLGGVSRYIRERRASRLRDLLCAPNETRSVAALAYAAGFATESHASRTFREFYGAAPGRYRRQQRDGGASWWAAAPAPALEPLENLLPALLEHP
nr:helix-turn-helix domain-containing protein [Aurantimonas endophytica]